MCRRSPWVRWSRRRSTAMRPRELLLALGRARATAGQAAVVGPSDLVAHCAPRVARTGQLEGEFVAAALARHMQRAGRGLASREQDPVHLRDRQHPGPPARLGPRHQAAHAAQGQSAVAKLAALGGMHEQKVPPAEGVCADTAAAAGPPPTALRTTATATAANKPLTRPIAQPPRRSLRNVQPRP